VAGLLLLLSSVGCTLSSRVTIERDAYGTPFIRAADSYGLFYGYGYAVGQDRLFQLEMLRRTALGKVAEVLGSEYLDLDIRTQAGFNPESIHRQIRQLDATQRSVLEGYAAGLNAWLVKVRQDPRRWLPREFEHFGFQPGDWTAYDVAMVFVGSMHHRYADFNEEIANLDFLHHLVARHGLEQAWTILDATMPLYGDAGPVTVPDAESSRARGPRHQRPADYVEQLLTPSVGVRRVLLDDEGRYHAAGSDLAHTRHERTALACSGVNGVAGFSTSSNLWLLNGSKVSDADASLFNGLQFGWSVPGYVYGVALHGAGYEVTGNTLLAYPAILFGHNRHIGWGSTAGLSDLVDIFQLRLNPDNHEQYWYRGEYVNFAKRQIEVAVKGGVTHRQWVYRSRYGPVISMDQGKQVAFSKKRSWEGQEIINLMAWVELGKARNFTEFNRQIKRMESNINFY